jgi:glycine cleavage system aminomethyltransferase T
LERNIGYAWVPVDRSTAGTKLSIEGTAGTATAMVVSMPFVDPTKEIPKS